MNELAVLKEQLAEAQQTAAQVQSVREQRERNFEITIQELRDLKFSSEQQQGELVQKISQLNDESTTLKETLNELKKEKEAVVDEIIESSQHKERGFSDQVQQLTSSLEEMEEELALGRETIKERDSRLVSQETAFNEAKQKIEQLQQLHREDLQSLSQCTLIGRVTLIDWFPWFFC